MTDQEKIAYVQSLMDKYLQDIDTYNPRDLTKTPKVSKYEQTASNCWIYSMCNDTYNNTSIEINNFKLENEIDKLGKDSQTGGLSILSALIICEMMKTKKIAIKLIDLRKKDKNGKYIKYTTNLDTKKIKLFSKLLKAGYVLTYSRRHGEEFQNDIKDDIVNEIISPTNKGQHSTNIWLNFPKLQELGTWGDSRYNEFVYENTDIFIKSVKNGSISPRFLFIDFA